MIRSAVCAFVALTLLTPRAKAQDASDVTPHWNQWGGAERNFGTVVQEELLRKPPKLLWQKKIGVGHSAIVTDGEHAYCKSYKDYEEIVERFQLATGECDWRFSFPVSYKPGGRYPGPHPTPLLTKGKLVLASSDAQILVVDINSG